MSNEVANTILAQLGANRFIAMTGAKNLCSHGPAPEFHKLGGLSFKIGSGAKDGITHVRVFLMNSDTYTVEFLKIRGASCKMVREVGMVYADNLRAVFKDATGFEVSL
jgi:hypothetical protein